MIQIVVLAGGLATRLRPITEKIPKSLININDEPFVIHQLRLFQSRGIKDVHFCLGYLGEMVIEVVQANHWDMNITFSFDGEKLLGTGGAIKNSLKYLSDPFFITYGDSYLDIEYSHVNAFYNIHKDGGKKGLMTVFHNDGQWDTSNVIYENNEIQIYSKKYKSEQMRYIDFGLGILTKKHFDPYSSGVYFDLSEIYEIAASNKTLLGYEVHNRFYEIGSFSGIQELSHYLTK